MLEGGGGVRKNLPAYMVGAVNTQYTEFSGLSLGWGDMHGSLSGEDLRLLIETPGQHSESYQTSY